jgi:hypothetical protein
LAAPNQITDFGIFSCRPILQGGSDEAPAWPVCPMRGNSMLRSTQAAISAARLRVLMSRIADHLPLQLVRIFFAGCDIIP